MAYIEPVNRAWFRFLEEQGVLKPTASAAFAEFVSPKSRFAFTPRTVERQVDSFAAYLKRENPELWLVYRTKRRLLGEGGE